jgi:outer membrane immunogenic protein
MKTPFFASVLLVTASVLGVADAADMPLKAPPPALAYTWTGCYVGGTAGAAQSKSDFTWSNISTGPGAFVPSAATALPAAANAALDSTGFTFGAEAGCNYQVNAFVLGVEGDWEHTGLGTSNAATSVRVPGGIAPGNIAESFSSQWLSTVRGRLGYAIGSLLLYGTGGLAIADVSYSDQICFPTAVPPLCNTASSSGTRTGWTAGAGAEWIFARSWSVKAEYLYVDLGNTAYTSTGVTSTGIITNATITHSHTLTENIGRVGLNYRF